jgi:4-alpha-glucanotransferase
MQQSDSSKNTKTPDLKSQKKAVAAPVTQVTNLSTSNQVRQKARLQKVSFWLRYATQYGQQIFITGNHPLLGNNNPADALPLHYFNEHFWTCSVDFSAISLPAEGITYHYFIKENGSRTHEWGAYKKIESSDANYTELTLLDSWNYAGYIENTFETEPFQKVLLKKHSVLSSSSDQQKATFTHQFIIKSPLLQLDETICLLGSGDTLGNWQTEKPVLLTYVPQTNSYEVSLNLTEDDFPIAYKYGIYHLGEKKFVRYENGNNRVAHDRAVANTLVRYQDGFFWLPNTSWKGTGIAIPVFSIRTNDGFGVGEFADIKKLVDWSAQIGLKLIQLLPVNDTTATHTKADSYPYAAISAFALHPMYLHLPAMADQIGMDELLELEPMRKAVNQTKAVDYEKVNEIKLAFCKLLYQRTGAATLASEAFKQFFKHNEHWLRPYAAFCYYRDLYGNIEFKNWPAHTAWDEQLMGGYFSDSEKSEEGIGMGYYCFLQYHLFLQLKEATQYAHSKGIIVKGDIAIGVYRNGADVWQQPELFNLNFQAGAPPDDFAVTGQNWGFPTYNWQKMKETGFAWWKQRFTQMSDYFDAFRIDHILGFFRIWSIPDHAIEGIMGRFVPAIPIMPAELNERGIHLSEARLTEPFINEQVLWQIFGYDNELVKSLFLIPTEQGNYQLKPAFATQQQVEKYFSDQENDGHHQKIKQGLFNLISNVIFFTTPNETGYHFRYGVEQTTSYRFLTEAYKQTLQHLYHNYFFQRQDDFWMKEALQKLPALKRETNMLICGEDLGMVPGCVPTVMQQLGLLSLEIQRMPKNPEKKFFHPNDAPYLSVVTPSTHDMSTIRGWWEENRETTEAFYHQELGQSGTAPFYCEAWINKAIVIQHLYSPAMWCVFQLQDLLGIDPLLRRTHPAEERINVPADPNNYWNYRMHITLEDLMNANGFNDEMNYFIKSSGR